MISSVMVEAVDALTDAEPALPDALSDRAQDGWEPLLAIADLAGGVWPDRSRQAAVSLAGGRDDDDGSMGHRLLSDCRLVFETTGADRLKTGDLIEHLAGMEDAPWGEYYGKPVTGRKISTWLKPYGIKPKTPHGFRGYVRADFIDAWARYLSVAPQSVPSVPFESGSGIESRLEVFPNETWNTSEHPGFPLNHAIRNTWNTSTPEPSEENGSGNASEPEIASDCDRRSLVADLISEIEAGRDRGDHPGLDPESWAGLREACDGDDSDATVEMLMAILQGAQ